MFSSRILMKDFLEKAYDYRNKGRLLKDAWSRIFSAAYDIPSTVTFFNQLVDNVSTELLHKAVHDLWIETLNDWYFLSTLLRLRPNRVYLSVHSQSHWVQFPVVELLQSAPQHGYIMILYVKQFHFRPN